MALFSRFDSAPRSLFPLPLAPFESMMLYDDRREYPMVCAAEFTFDGQLDRAKFESAFERARQRHPLFCAHISERRNRPHRWVATATTPQLNFVGGPEELSTCEFAPIDLRTEVGVRLAVSCTARQTHLLFDFHHACSDGVGGLSFVEDVLACYAAEFNERISKLPDRDPFALRERGIFPGATGLSLRRLYNECSDVLETGRFFGRCPARLADDPSRTLRVVSDCATPRMVSRTLDAGFLAELRTLAAASQVTVNDLLVQALFITMRDWNTSRQEVRPTDCFRILTPTTLRTRAHLPMPAANRLSYAFYTRRLSELNDREKLLQWLRSETSRIRQTRFPERVLSKLAILSCIPGGLPLVMNLNRCLATVILSNVGDPTRRFQARFPRERGRLVAGNLILTGLTAMTPLRPQTRATLFVNTYANRLTISARLDPQFFSPTEGYLFLDQLTATLASSTQVHEMRGAA